MKILFIGDIYGRPGREAVKKLLPSVSKEYDVDFVIGNCENMSHGSGFTPEHIAEMQKAGIDFFTTGNHTWAIKKGAEKLSDPTFPVIRPANYPDEYTSGDGYRVVDVNGAKILVINLMARVFMKKQLDCPFRKADEVLKKFENEDLNGVFVDFHGEATSEKYALAYYLDGRVSAVVGTHTHVPTADARVLPEGTAFMCDAGMTGVLDSVIGAKKETVIKSFLTQIHQKREPATEGKKVLNGFLVELDLENKKALNACHIQKFID